MYLCRNILYMYVKTYKYTINNTKYLFVFRPTFVHNFIIRDSIEENITNLFSENMFDQWDDVTLSQLIRVFERNESDSIPEENNDTGE